MNTQTNGNVRYLCIRTLTFPLKDSSTKTQTLRIKPDATGKAKDLDYSENDLNPDLETQNYDSHIYLPLLLYYLFQNNDMTVIMMHQLTLKHLNNFRKFLTKLTKPTFEKKWKTNLKN